MKPTLSSKWEISEEYDYLTGQISATHKIELNVFIRKLLSSHHKELIEKIEREVEKKKTYNRDESDLTRIYISHEGSVYNQALNDVLSILKKI